MKKKETKKKSGVKHDPHAMLKAMKKEVKSLKQEAKALHTELKDEEASLEKEKSASAAEKKVSQREQLKGNELLKLSHLTNMMGFEEEAIRGHLEEENKKLEKLQKDKQQDRKNIETNINKMKEMNEKSEKAVGAATEQYDKAVAESSRLKEQLNEAELKLYSIETKVKHSRGMKAVEITNKDALRDGIKEVANEVKRRCDDKEVVIQVLKVAAKCLAANTDASFSSVQDGNNNSDSSNSVDISSASSDDDD
jgi:predicted  nucleic acid-binding Zn-ribbon protein